MQIVDLNSRLPNVGDYAWFQNHDGAFVFAFRYSLDYWGFYSEDASVNGSNEPRNNTYLFRFPYLRRFCSSWRVKGSYSLRDGVNDIQMCTNLELTLLTQPIGYPPMLDDARSVITNYETLYRNEPTDNEQENTNSMINKNYEKRIAYRGIHGYHYHHGVHLNEPVSTFSGHRIGIELEVEFNSESARSSFAETESNWFYLERDGSLNSLGCEIISIPLLPKDAKSADFWKVLTDRIKNVATSWDNGRCGLHVHVGREILGNTEEKQSETIGKLLYLYHHYVKETRMNIKIYGRERGYHDEDGKTVTGTYVCELGSEVLKIKSVKDKVKDAMIQKSSSIRYFDINLMNTHTIEFRKGKGSINPARIAMVVDYCERMCLYAKSTPWPQISYVDFVKYLKSTVKNVDLLNLVNSYS